MDSPREPLFAGSWYPNTLEEAEAYLTPDLPKCRAAAVVVPHAAWMYSGRVAGAVYSRIEPADTYIVLGPNHSGHGRAETSLYTSGRWNLPQTHVDIDDETARAIFEQSEFLADDPTAHRKEHCIEVQLSFLLLANPKARLVPILLRNDDPEILRDLGRSLAAAIRKLSDRRIVLVASTDLTHYESRRSAAVQDQAAIDQMTAVDGLGLHEVVTRQGITMCGVAGTASVLLAAKALGAGKGELIRYATSGDVTGEDDSVVGYAGVLIPA
jgi:AmmeMemoRadiSam system protein B